MQESAKAAQAFNDYLALGADRSFEKLLNAYKLRTENAPTLQLTTLKRWSVAFNWQDRLLAIQKREQDVLEATGIAEKQNRLNLYVDVANRLRRLLNARAADVGSEVAGGDTGLLVRQAKLVKVYETPENPKTDSEDELVSAKREVLVYEYVLDAALLREVREFAKQTAQETGQWVEKQASSGDMKIQVEYADRDIDPAASA